MPTPGEKRALIFVAAVAALGVAVRGLREIRGDVRAAPVAGDRAGLARQIEAVDSAISVNGERRRPASARVGGAAAAVADGRQPPRQSRGRRTIRTDDKPARPGADDRMPRGRNPRSEVLSRSVPPDARATYRERWAQQDAERQRINARLDGSSPAHSESRRTGTIGRSARLPLRELAPLDLDIATAEAIAALPMIGAALARRIVSDRIERGPFGSIDGLTRVRGVGRALARRLLPYVTFSLASRLEVDSPATAAPRRRRRP